MASSQLHIVTLPVSISAQRPATPVTPVHSAHHSISSTGSRTPVHSLSLHEYRKLQAEPSPRSVSGSKRVRRKPAASGLNGIERIRSTPVQMSAPSQLPQWPNVFPSFAGEATQQEPEQTAPTEHQFFQTRPSPPPTPPRITSSAHSAPAVFSSASFSSSSFTVPPLFHHPRVAIDDSPHPRLPLPPISRDIGKSFKPIKRLPRPLNIGLRPSIPSPLRSEATNSTLGSILDRSTDSTVSLSRFPPPPLLPDARSLEKAPLLSTPIGFPATSTGLDTPPATPAVLHYRGASFDLVNPHDSLYLHEIETPGERDGDSFEYFDLSHSPESARVNKMSHRDAPGDIPDAAPQRALYQDLPSAYRSITRSHQSDATINQDLNTGLPSPPSAVFTHRTTRLSSNESTDVPNHASANRRSLLTRRRNQQSSGFMQRVSRAFSRRKSAYRDTQQLTSEEGSELLQLPAYRRAGYAQELPVESLSTPNITGNITSSPPVEQTRGEGRASVSENNIRLGDYYDDDESRYPSTIGGQEDNESIYRLSTVMRRSVPFGYLNRETDYSSEVDIHSYDFEFAESSRITPRISTTSNGLPAQTPVTQRGDGVKDNTINSILERYNGMEGSDSLHEHAEEVASHGTRRGHFQNSPSQQALIPQAKEASRPVFGLEREISEHTNTTSRGQNSPRLGYNPRVQGLFGGFPGSPPPEPPPPEPSFQLGRSERLFSHNNISNSSNFISRAGTSYGDTRNLLQLSNTPYLPSGNRDFTEETLRSGSEQTLTTSCLQRTGENVQEEATGHEIPKTQYIKGAMGRPSYSPPAIAADACARVSPLARGSSGDGGLPQPPLTTEYQQDVGHKPTSSGIPVMWRGASPVRRPTLQSESPERESYADITDDEVRGEEGENDWETIGYATRPDLTHEQTGESIADYSSYNSLASSPYPNPMPPPLPNNIKINFRGSPPIAGNTLSPTGPRPEHVNLEEAGEDSDDSHSESGLHPLRHVPLYNRYSLNLSPQQTQDLLDSGPNDEIIEASETDMYSPYSHNDTSGDRNPEFEAASSNQEFREFQRTVPQSVVTPTRERIDSVARAIVPSQEVKAADTPQGVGIRVVSTSETDASSPGPGWDNTPTPRARAKSTNAVRFLNSPHSTTASPDGTLRHKPSDSRLSISSEDRLLAAREWTHHRRQRTREFYQARSKTHASRSKRSSVRGQTRLREMALQAPDNVTIRRSQSILDYIPSERATPVEVDSPVPAPRRVVPILASESSPHLLRVPLPDSEAVHVYVHRRARKLSWLILMMTAWFPPFAILYAYGYLDWLIWAWSKHEIDECGRFQKRVALWWGMIGSPVLTVAIIVLVLLRYFGLLA